MKRFTGILIAALLVLAPLSASALEALTDSAMSDVTGQAGVDIALDDVAILIESVQDTTYTDTDSGLGIKIEHENDMNKLILLDGIYDETADGQVLNYNVAAIDNMFSTNTKFTEKRAAGNFAVGITTLAGQASWDSFAMRPTPLRIDIGKCEILSAARDYYLEAPALDTYKVGGVIIGLPTVTIEIFSSNDTKRIKLDYNEALYDGDDRQTALASYGGIVAGAVSANRGTAGMTTTEQAQIATLVSNEIVSKGTSCRDAVQIAVGAGSIAQSAAGMDEYIAITKTGYAKYAILGGTLEIAPH